MSHTDLRASLESSFINGLLSRLLSTVETGSVLEAKDLIRTISSIAIHRIHSVITELELCLTDKSCNFHYIRSSDNPKEKTEFTEEILLIMEVVHQALECYCDNDIEYSREGESFQTLSKNTCSKLMSTVGGVVFYHSQFQEFSTAVRLDGSCGKILSILSEINHEAAVSHVKQVLKKCLEPQAESRGNFYTLKSLQYMSLNTEALLTLFGNIADSIDQPTNSGKWKKNAMLDMTTPLRLCLLRWLEFDTLLVHSVFNTEQRSDDHPNIVFLLHKLEPWASGAKKRSSVWPLINMLVALMPRAFQAAVKQLKATNPSVSSSKLTLEAKILKKTLDNLTPSAMQSVLQKDSALFTELSVISLVLMMRIAATLKRRLTYPTDNAGSTVVTQNAGASHQGGSTYDIMHRSHSASAPRSNSGAEAALQALWSFLSPHLDRLREIVYSGMCPSQHYYTAISSSPFTTFSPSLSQCGSNGNWEDHLGGSDGNISKTTVVEEITPDCLVNSYMWSLFYGDQPKYLSLMIRILGPCKQQGHSSHSVSSFIRVGAIRALNFILVSDHVDRQGKTPTWRLTAASAVRTAVLDIITQFRSQYLLSNEINDKERDVICALQGGGRGEWMDSVDSDSGGQHIGGNQSRDSVHDYRFDIDPDTVMAVLKLIRYNPWFVFVRRSFDEPTNNIVLSTVFTAHLTGLIRDVVSIASTDCFGDYDLPGLAEEAFSSMLNVKFINMWTPKDPFNGVLNVNAILLKTIATELLRCSSNDQVRCLRLLRCMNVLLLNVNEYIGEEDLLRGASSASEVVDALVHVAVSSAEAALLIHCCSGDTDIISLALQCFRLLCIHNEYLTTVEYRIADGSDGNSSGEDHMDDSLLNGIYVRPSADVWPIYREMAANTGQILSIKLQQKSIRSFLSRIPCRTQGMNWALYEIMHRWAAFNTYVHNGSTYNIPPSQSLAFDEWRNYTGFLCALGAGLSQSVSPCTDDYLVPILHRVVGYEDQDSRPHTPIGRLSDDRRSWSQYSPRFLVRSMLHLILLQHADRRVSVDVFMAIGMYLAPSLVYLLFQELGVIQDVLLDVLGKRCEMGIATPTRSAIASERNVSQMMMQDFDSFISEMTLLQINGFVNAILTMLQMIFDRDWQKSTANAPAMTTRTSETSLNKEIGVTVEKMIIRLVQTVLKLQKQLELDDDTPSEPSSRSSSTVSSSHGYTGVLEVQQNTSEQFRLKKKTADMTETLIIKRGTWKPSSGFRMRLLNVLMDWTSDCISHIEMSTTSTTSANASSGAGGDAGGGGSRSSYSKGSTRYSRGQQQKRSSGNSTLETLAMPNSIGGNVSNTTVSAEDLSLFKGTELACVKAIKVMLEGSELSCEAEEDAASVISPAPNASVSNKKATMSDVDKKSKIFYKYFHVLQNVLLSCFVHSEISGREELNGIAVDALCNLLHANTGIGLQHMVSAAGTHDNQSLRGALLKVFIEVLSRRMDPLTFGLAPKIPSYDDALNELMTMLLAPDRELAKLLCASARGREAEEVAKALLLICEKHDAITVVKLLDWTIEHEIANTARLGTLFRSESMGTKLMGAYFGSKGKNYLVDTLKAPILQYLHSSLTVEVDPTKGVDPSQIKENMENLQCQTEIFLNAIIDSVHKGCPKELKHILSVLRGETVKKFSTTEGCDRIAVAGYTFLRFFCPAIAMPAKFGLTVATDSTQPQQTESPVLTRQQTRGLLLIAKILQNLANGTHFFEECMEPLNPWIDRHAESISYFCYEISTEESLVTRSESDCEHCESDGGGSSSTQSVEMVGNAVHVSNDVLIADATSTLLLSSAVTADDSENSSSGEDEDDDDSKGKGSGAMMTVTSSTCAASTLSAAGRSSSSSSLTKRHSFNKLQQYPNHDQHHHRKPQDKDEEDNERDFLFSAGNWSEDLQAALVSIHKYMYYNQERMERIIAPSGVQVDGSGIDGVTAIAIDDSESHSQRPRSTQTTAGAGMGAIGGSSHQYGDYPRVREKLAGLLMRLGEPLEDLPASGENDGVVDKGPGKHESARSECDIFISDINRRPNSKQIVEGVRASQIFYAVPPPTTSSTLASGNSTSSATSAAAASTTTAASSLVASSGSNTTTFFFVCRRVTAETEPSILLYVIASEIRNVMKAGGMFDLVIDSSSFNTDAELPMWSYSIFWGKLKSLLGSWCATSLRKIYVLYPSIVVIMSARKVLKKWGIKTRHVVDKVEVVTPIQLVNIQPHLADKIPRSTVGIESGSVKKWQALLHEREVTISISGSLLLVQTLDKFGGIEYKRSDILSLHLVDNISVGSAGNGKSNRKAASAQSESLKRKFAIQSSSRATEMYDQSVVITYTASQSTRALKLLCSHSAHFLSTLSIALTQVRQQRALEEASQWAGTKVVHPDAIPGMLLHIALLNLFSELLSTRKASFLLLCQMKHTYELPLSLPTESGDISGLFVPSNLVHFASSVSAELASIRPEYGKELLFECFQAIRRPVTRQFQKMAVVLYLTPWLPLLELFYQHCVSNKPASHERDQEEVIPSSSLASAGEAGGGGLVGPGTVGEAGSGSPQYSPSGANIPKMRRKSTQDICTPLKSGTASFIYTTPESAGYSHESSPKAVHLATSSQPPAVLTTTTTNPSNLATSMLRGKEVLGGISSSIAAGNASGKELNLKLMGGRVVDISIDQLLLDVEEVFETALMAACDDGAVGEVIYLEIWNSIAHMPMLSSIALKYFIKRWKYESSRACASTKLFTARDNRASTNYGTPSARKHSGTAGSAVHMSSGRGTYSFLASQTPPSTSSALDSSASSSAQTESMRKTVDAQAVCSYCNVMCEAAALIGRQHPSMFCDYLLGEIHSLSAKLSCKSSSSTSSRSAPSSSTIKLSKSSCVDSGMAGQQKPFAQLSGQRQNQSQIPPPPGQLQTTSPTSTKQHQLPLPQGSDMPYAVLDGVHSFFSVPTSPVGSPGHHRGSGYLSGVAGVSKRGSDPVVSASIRSAMQTSMEAVADATSVSDSTSSNSSICAASSTRRSSCSGVAGGDSTTGGLCPEPSEHDMLLEIIYLLRPLFYLVHLNGALLVESTPKILHLAVTLLSQGKAILMPHVHVLISSLVYAMVACASNSDSSIQSAVNPTSGSCLMAQNIPIMSLSSLLLPSSITSPPTMSPVMRRSHCIVQQQPQGDFEVGDEINGNAPEDEDDLLHSNESRKPSVSAAAEEVDFATLCTAESIQLWKSVLTDFNSDAFQLIFRKAPTLTPNNFERVATTLANIVQDSTSVLCVSWRRVMWELALSSARKTTDNSQSSSFFLVVGSLIHRSMDTKDTDACLAAVFGALLSIIDICIKNKFNEHDEPILRPILFCLSRSIPLMNTDDIKELFWFTVLLLVYFPTSYLSGPVVLQYHIVVELLDRIEPDNGNIESSLLQARRSSRQLNRIFKRLEKEGQAIIGVSFESSFSTALACVLLRGFQVSETKTRDITEETLRMLLDHYQHQSELQQQQSGDMSGPGRVLPSVKRSISGYGAVLLTVWGDISLVSQPQPQQQQSALHSESSDINERETRRYSASPTPPSQSLSSGAGANAVAHRKAMMTMSAVTSVSTRHIVSTVPTDPVYRPAQQHLQLQRQRSSSRLMFPDSTLAFTHVSFFGEHNFPTNKSLVLFTTMLLTCVRTLQNMEEEQLFVHKLLLQTIRELPTVLTVLYDILFAEMSAAYATSANNESPLHKARLDILNECLMSGFSRQHLRLKSTGSCRTENQSEIDDDNPQRSAAAAAAGSMTSGYSSSHSEQISADQSTEEKMSVRAEAKDSLGATDAGQSVDTMGGSSVPLSFTTCAVSATGEQERPVRSRSGSTDTPFARGSVQYMGDGIDSDDDDISGTGEVTSAVYLTELGFAGLLEGAHFYALGNSAVRGKCVCGGYEGYKDSSEKICESCVKRKDAKHLLSSAVRVMLRDFHFTFSKRSEETEEVQISTDDSKQPTLE